MTLRGTFGMVAAVVALAGCGGAKEPVQAENKCDIDIEKLEGGYVWGQGLGSQLKPQWLFRGRFFEEGGTRKLTLLMGSPTFTRVQLTGEKDAEGKWQYVEAPQYEGEALENYKKTNTSVNNRLRVNVKVEVDSSCRLVVRDGWDTFVDGKERWKQSDLGSKVFVKIPDDREYSFETATERVRMFDAAESWKAAEAEGAEYQQYMIDRMEEDFAVWSPLTDRQEGCTYSLDFYRDDRPVEKGVAVTPEEKDGHLRWVYHHKFEYAGLGTVEIRRYRECAGKKERLAIADNVIDVAKQLEEVKTEASKGKK